MTPERQAKLKELRERLKALTPAQRQLLFDRGMIATIEGRVLSAHNTIMVYFQSTRIIPTLVGGFKQWKAAGRSVKKGEHGYTIWFPVGQKDEDGELLTAERYFTGTVFDISQTEEIKQAAPVGELALAGEMR